MSGKEEEFVPVGRRKDRREKKEKKPQQEKPKQQKEAPKKEAPKEAPKKEEKPAVEESKPVIDEKTLICPICYNIGHKADSCPDKKPKSDIRYCSRCGKAGHRAADCKASLDSGCFFCGEHSHHFSLCPVRAEFLREDEDGKKKEFCVICRNCGGLGHKSSECKQPSLRAKFCHNCGEEGHNAEECDKPVEKLGSTIVCHRCGEIGHTASDCKVPSMHRLEVCPICGQFGHGIDECPSDMPSKPASEKPAHEKVQRKKLMTSTDLQDVEQFPSL